MGNNNVPKLLAFRQRSGAADGAQLQKCSHL
jgi:hypothetical protein